MNALISILMLIAVHRTLFVELKTNVENANDQLQDSIDRDVLEIHSMYSIQSYQLVPLIDKVEYEMDQFLVLSLDYLSTKEATV